LDRKWIEQNGLSAIFSKTKASTEKNRPETEKVSAEDDSPPLPSPLAVRQRKANKFRRKSEHRRPSYFIDHNRRRADSNRVVSDVPLETIQTPLFPSLA
jgi:hypothetical protein